MAGSGELPSLETDDLSVQYISLSSLPSPSLVAFPPDREHIFNSPYEVVTSSTERSATVHPIAVAGSSRVQGPPLRTRYTYPKPIDQASGPIQYVVPQSSGLYPQTGHLRRVSDSSSDGHTPEQEASPEGSPKDKYEEIVPTGATWDKDKARFRDRPRPEQWLLDTFLNWPSSYPAERLATAGFIYTGIDDMVSCTKCGKTLFDWKPSDDPYLEHRRIHNWDCFRH